MKKEKYIVYASNGIFFSNSRNARKHLLETNSTFCDIYTNNELREFVCRAYLSKPYGIVLSGAAHK